MSDVREDYEAMKQHKRKEKELRWSQNFAYLVEHNVNWQWVDKLSDHILINDEIDYYLAKTYWFNRRTKSRGYTMLHKLLNARAKDGEA